MYGSHPELVKMRNEAYFITKYKRFICVVENLFSHPHFFGSDRYQ